MIIAFSILAALFGVFLIFAIFSEYMIRFMLSRKSSVWMTREKPDPIFFTEESLKARKEVYLWLARTDSVFIKSHDGLRLHAYRSLNHSSHNWLITAHGYRGSSTNNGSLAMYFADKGWNVLVIEQRAHGESEGKWITMGKEESKDLISWIDYVRKLDKDAEIVLHGESMAGATVMMTAGRNPKNVVAAIEDCGYTRLLDEYIHQVESNTFFRGRPFVSFLNLWARFRVGIDFREVLPIVDVTHTKLPMLFIHGDKDKLVPTWMGLDVYNAADTEKELWITKNTGHAVSIEYHRKKYCERIYHFALRYVKNKGLKLEKKENHA